VLSPSTTAVDTREKLQAYRAIHSLRYYVMVDSERVAATYSVRGADGQWLEASLDPGEQLDIECGAMRTSLNLTGIYEETSLTVA
jgi:Uma2 family endonuclease